MEIKKTKFKLPLNKIKHWNFKELEWFLISDSFFFNEYGLYETKNLIGEFIKKNKKKSITLFEEIERWDITINFTWLISVTSWLWYTPDKISHVSLWFRKKINMINLVTDDNNYINLTPWQLLLTNSGYKKAEDININDELIWSLWSAKTFKNSKYKKYENITDIIKTINKYFDKSWILDYNGVPKKYLKYLNILWIDSNKELKKEDFLNIIDKETKKDITEWNIWNIWDILWWKNNIFKRKIKQIRKIEMKNIYIWNITTHLSSNININNFILEQWA